MSSALESAFAAYQRGDATGALATLEQEPDAWRSRPDGWLIRGVASRALGRVTDAESAYREAIALYPDYPDAWQNLGNLLAATGRFAHAADAYEHAAQGRPTAAEKANVLVLLAGAAFSAGEVKAALSALERAVALAPESGAVHNQLGKVLWELGHTQASIDAFRKAAHCAPADALYATNLLLVSQFSETATEPELSALARMAAERVEQGVPAALKESFVSPAWKPGERIRVGYVSSDFRVSAPGFFIDSILAGHDRSRFEVWALATAAVTDELSQRMRGRVDQWQDVSGMSAADLTAWARERKFHVLVDLNGFTGGHRLGVFAARAAPVQITWLGYEGPTRLDGMDAFLGDPNVTPDTTLDCYSERVLRLPFDFACYAPPSYAPPVAPAPSLSTGCITFGSFNKLAKLGLATLELWARVLGQVPGSRLLVKWRHADQAFARERIASALAGHGIAGSRVEFRDASPHPDMLAQYADVDIALDPTPFSGGATTCDALWMGVPVVTLRGHRFASNHTTSHLQAAGFPELVARSADDYVSICVRLAADIPALERLRQGMRAQLSVSPLCNAALFMRPVERHYESLVRERVAGLRALEP